MQKDELIYLVHMLDAGSELQEYMQGRALQDYNSNGMFRRSVERMTEIIGEAARQVPQSTRDRYPQIPWAAIIGMRNRIVHDYLGLDSGILWETATLSIPILMDELRKVVPPEMQAEP
jgi:uncharacterized protein with HEPN domain